MTTETKTADQSDVTTELYRAALGPCSQAYYLRRFDRFDAAGKAGLSWHWPACMGTLNWLLFRKMWAQATGYAGLLFLAGLLVLVVGPLVQAYVSPIPQLLLIGLLVGIFVVPGLYANATYYRFCERKITRALGANQGVENACEQLAAQAPTPRRWRVLAALNLGGAALAAGVVVLAPGADLAEKWRLLRLGDTPMLAGATPESIGPVVEGPVSTPSLSAETTLEARPSTDGPGPIASAPAAVLSPVPETAAAELPSPVMAPLPEPSGSRYFIQIGAFADERNVQKLSAQLQSAGLTPLIDTVQFKIGPVKRVRVGPYLTQEQADEVGVKVKDLGLPAHRVKQ